MDAGFVGLGAMGSAMARNLVKAGHTVRAWNRSGDGGIAGLAMVAEPADALQAEVVFTMLSDDPAIREVLLSANVLRTARPGLVHVVTKGVTSRASRRGSGSRPRAGRRCRRERRQAAAAARRGAQTHERDGGRRAGEKDWSAMADHTLNHAR